MKTVEKCRVLGENVAARASPSIGEERAVTKNTYFDLATFDLATAIF